MKQRKRRKTVKLRCTVQFNDPKGVLADMTPAQATAYVTRLLRKLIRDKKRISLAWASKARLAQQGRKADQARRYTQEQDG